MDTCADTLKSTAEEGEVLEDQIFFLPATSFLKITLPLKPNTSKAQEFPEGKCGGEI